MSQLEAPPGFEGPPRYRKQARRSPRLHTKNAGSYVSAVDKARATQGFITVTKLMQKPKIKVKSAAKPLPNYRSTSTSLTQAHAEAVVAAAGVELEESLVNKITEAAEMSALEHAAAEVN